MSLGLLRTLTIILLLPYFLHFSCIVVSLDFDESFMNLFSFYFLFR